MIKFIITRYDINIKYNLYYLMVWELDFVWLTNSERQLFKKTYPKLFNLRNYNNFFVILDEKSEVNYVEELILFNDLFNNLYQINI